MMIKMIIKVYVFMKEDIPIVRYIIVRGELALQIILFVLTILVL